MHQAPGWFKPTAYYPYANTVTHFFNDVGASLCGGWFFSPELALYSDTPTDRPCKLCSRLLTSTKEPSPCPSTTSNY